jgi:outer membrane protein assembly factor BamB/uncharacterized protein YceK
MIQLSYAPQRVVRHLSFIVLPLVMVLLISGCSSSRATTPATPTLPTSSAKGQSIYTLILSSQASPKNPAIYDLNAYDSADGHLRFSHTVSRATGGLVATTHFLGVLALLPVVDPHQMMPNYSLLMYDTNGMQTQQTPLGLFTPQQMLASDDTIFAAGPLPGTDPAARSQVQVLAVNASTGAVLWKKIVANATGLTNFVVVGHEVIGIFQTETGPQMTALDVVSGSQSWQMATTSYDGAEGAVIAGSDAVYSAQFSPPPNSLQKSGASLIATVAATGATRWSQPFTPSGGKGAAVQIRLIAADQQAVYGEISSGTSGTNVTSSLVAFSATDGHQIWNVPEMASLSSNAPGLAGVLIQSGLYATALGPAPSTNLGPPPDLLIGVNMRTGASLWRTTLAAAPLTPLIGTGNGLYVALTGQPSTTTPHAQGNATIVAYNANTGAQIWHIQTSGATLAQLVVSP